MNDIKNKLQDYIYQFHALANMSMRQSEMLSGTAKEWEDSFQTEERQHQAKFYAGKAAGFERSAKAIELVLQEFSRD